MIRPAGEESSQDACGCALAHGNRTRDAEDERNFDLVTGEELRGDEIADEISVSINLGIDVSIPKDYIVEASQRLRTYKRIASAESEEALSKIHAEIEDRYGKIPRSVDALFAYGRLRKLAERMGVISVDRSGSTIAIKLSENTKVDPEKLMSLLAANEKASFSPNGILRMEIGGDPIETAMDVLSTVKG